jgi:periplasmic protein TonB
MAANDDIFSKEWVELVLGSRNQQYGAYELRSNSPKRHFWALLLGSIFFVLVVMVPILLKQIIPEEVDKELTVRTMSDITLEKPKEIPVLRDIPPPPPMRNTIKFTPPVIKPDDLVHDEEQPIMQKEAVETKAAISNVTFDKGTDDISAPVATAEKKVEITEEPEKPFIIVEQMPQFPGGEKEMMKFIKNNLRYPANAIEMGISGTVTVNFVVGRDGKITEIKVIRGIGGGCDEEAVRILEKMPPWSPGKQGGRAVLVSYTVPFKFILQ